MPLQNKNLKARLYFPLFPGPREKQKRDSYQSQVEEKKNPQILMF